MPKEKGPVSTGPSPNPAAFPREIAPRENRKQCKSLAWRNFYVNFTSKDLICAGRNKNIT